MGFCKDTDQSSDALQIGEGTSSFVYHCCGRLHFGDELLHQLSEIRHFTRFYERFHLKQLIGELIVLVTSLNSIIELGV